MNKEKIKKIKEKLRRGYPDGALQILMDDFCDALLEEGDLSQDHNLNAAGGKEKRTEAALAHLRWVIANGWLSKGQEWQIKNAISLLEPETENSREDE